MKTKIKIILIIGDFNYFKYWEKVWTIVKSIISLTEKFSNNFFLLYKIRANVFLVFLFLWKIEN